MGSQRGDLIFRRNNASVFGQGIFYKFCKLNFNGAISVFN